MMNQVYIAIGSNLDDPIINAQRAIEALRQLPNSRFISASSLYSSKPMGPQDQPDYVNAVALIATELSPLALLDQTQAIEHNFGRVRKAERWGARTLDLDILLFGDEVITNERLTIPHYGMNTREFVLYPLAEIAPTLCFPDGKPISFYLEQVPLNGLTAIKN